VPSTIALSDASAIEGDIALKHVDGFVTEGSGGLMTPRGSVFGPDGNGDAAQDLYVASGNSDEVLRYDGVTGAFIDAFVPAGSGGLDGPVDLAFGPDGNLYVSSLGNGQVLKYDSSGAFIEVAVSGLSVPLGLTFDGDGQLYIANQNTNEVLRFDGANVSVFVSAGSGGLARPRQGVFGPDGNFYVASADTNQVLRYNGLTGAFVDVFAATTLGGTGPSWVEFSLDGYLYASARTFATGLETSIVRFDANTGAFVDRFDLGRDGWSFIIGPDNVVYNSSNGSGNFIDRLGSSSTAVFTVNLSSASATPVTVDYSTTNGSALAGSDYTAATGTLTFAPGQTSRTILVHTLDDATGEPTETFTLTLSNPIGATIADGTGVGTILDNETKFFVVDDATANQTFEYGSGGASVESYTLTAANTAPRGAASNAAGDKVWVVDANKKVYVYNTSGGLLGSWTAGSLTGNAIVEGVATDGADIWIVDAKQDKVFRYTGAASRLSGSQNAASSFSLNSGNKDPKDIVTDGTSLWVVNSSTTDKVFKYTLAGSLLGSWTIDAANSSPTGITLDPTNVAHLWIVDNGTDRVYQYDNAASRTSGSQSASTSFALAAGNTNPQGLADPPGAGAISPVTKKQSCLEPDAIDQLFALENLGRGKKRGWHWNGA
jgi:sugar lactone lactonase YvrE